MAKTPFSYQATEYDCVPVTFINALRHLFERKEIPPIVIQRIWQYSLDVISKRGELGVGGTSGTAVDVIVKFLNSYREKGFAVKCDYLPESAEKDEQKYLNPKWNNDKRVSILCVCMSNSKNKTHYVLGLGTDKNDSSQFLIFDPYKKTPPKDYENGANAQVSVEKLNSEDFLKYSMGPFYIKNKQNEDEAFREYVLLERIT